MESKQKKKENKITGLRGKARIASLLKLDYLGERNESR